VWSTISASQFDLGSGLNNTRLDRSRSARLDLWQSGFDAWTAHPTGIGSGQRVDIPGAPGAQSELHNDAIAFLVDNGPLGLLAVASLVIVIWRSLARGGPGRALLAGLIASSLVRQTWNFRHAWLMLAVVAAYEMAEWTRHKADEVPAVDAGARAKAL
jgi:O-antigen ligase